MTRNLKALGLALVAVFAMSAIAAQAASAANHEFTSEVETTYLTGEQIGQHVFTAGTAGVEVKCETATFTGEQTGKEADKVRMTPNYGGHCTFAGLEVTITNKADCEYEFDSDTTDGEDATVRLDCNDNTEGMVIDAPGCTVYIGDTHTGGVSVNQNMYGVSYHNEADPTLDDVTVTATVEEITYESKGFLCGALGLHATGHDGKYFGDTTVTGYSDEAHETQVGITVD